MADLWLRLSLVLLTIHTTLGVRLRYEFAHHRYEDLQRIIAETHSACPDISRVYNIGRSVQGRNLTVIEFSDNPGTHEPGEPEVKYVANMHGNEVTGREMLLLFMQYLCNSFNSVWRVKRLIKSTRIHILATMNPDGYEIAARQGPDNGWRRGRENVQGIDLNRNFPALNTIAYNSEQHGGPTDHIPIPNSYWEGNVAPETEAVIKWIKQYPFVISANLHDGALLANYPYDQSKDDRSWKFYTPAPDDAVFRQIASTYANAHRTMSKPDSACDSNSDFGNQGGITNGADWYSTTGGMQDFNYLHTDCFDITLELSCDKFPPAGALPTEWRNNRKALLAYIEEAHKGIKGFVLDRNLDPIEGATIHVDGINHDVTTAKDGDYWRILVPGTYMVTASYKGMTRTKQVTVSTKRARTLNFVMGVLRTTRARVVFSSPTFVQQRGPVPN
ncbi:carboxypeptidase N catalytic chain-like [Branchiostoma lanceolatum]|uniref:carboxypeptidase N catalytic chain-like n=1 Tax=Branchiostoma lanceolatum TaxID=7740 RepID=UPI003453FA29